MFTPYLNDFFHRLSVILHRKKNIEFCIVFHMPLLQGSFYIAYRAVNCDVLYGQSFDRFYSTCKKQENVSS